jgi:hypothetical protein
MTAPKRPYAPLSGPISSAAAEAEPPARRAFPEEPLPADLGRRPSTPKPNVAPAPTGAPKSQITLSTTIQHRGRTITISATDITADRFCDLLDAAGYASPAPSQWQTLPDGTPLCPKHNTPMKLRNKQGDEWWSHRVFGPDGEELWCKGYHGKDSPGYEY